MKNVGTLLLFHICLWTSSGPCFAMESKFTFVAFDGSQQQGFGVFPNREAIASLVDKISKDSPSAIALKFFFDLPGDVKQTSTLVDKVRNQRVMLQASLNGEPPTSRDLDNRFVFSGSFAGIRPDISGDEGWLPIKSVADVAHKVCFANVLDVHRLPTLVLFQKRPVRSMYSCLLEEAYGNSSVAFRGNQATFGAYSVNVDPSGSIRVAFSEDSKVHYVSAADVLRGNVSRSVLQNKVVVIVYTGPNSPLALLNGKMFPVHHVFALQLLAAERALIKRP